MVVRKAPKAEPVMGRDVPFDILTASQRHVSAINAAKQIRELQHALAGIETIEVAEQLLSGLLLTQEALDKIADILRKLPPLQPGDLDLLTGLRMPSSTDGADLDLTPGGGE